MRYRRLYVPGGSYFITVALANRRSNLLIESIDKLKNAFKKVRNRHDLQVDAIVVLPDHFHMLITLPKNDANYSKRVRLMKSYFSKSIEVSESISNSRKQKSERGIWQRRFWEHTIRDENDFESHVNYMHYNPVKHKYVLNPVNWRYSSIHRYVKLGLLRANWSVSNNLLD